MSETERVEGDRLRRQSAVMRFLSAMHDMAGERDLVRALIQAAAVWFDLDARAYRRDLTGRFVAEMWLPGVDSEDYPKEIDGAVAIDHSGSAVRVSSVVDLDQLGWRSYQNEVLLLPLAGGRDVDWLIVIAGVVDREAETTLTVVCRTAGAALEHLAEHRARELETRLTRRLAAIDGSVPSIAQGALEELLAATGAARGRLVVRTREGSQAVTLAAVGQTSGTVDAAELAPGYRSVTPERIALAARLTGSGASGLELRASEQTPFDPAQARAAETGLSVVATWLGGVVAGGGIEPSATRPQTAPTVEARRIEAAIGDEMDRVRRLSLRGGVLVASPAAETPTTPAAVSSIIEAMRDELRSSDLLGQLSTGEIAALLVRASAEGVLAAAWRVRKRLEQLTRERRLPAVVLGHALYPAEGADSLGALVTMAKKTDPADPTEGWRFVM